MSKSRQIRGFTLTELLIVVVIVGILAAVAVVAYQKYVAQARKSEVFSMIASIKSSEEAYKAESSQYLSTTTSGETDYYPALGSGGSEPSLKQFNPTSDGKTLWTALSVSAPQSSLYCGYVVVAGNADDLSGAGARGRTLFNNVAPSRPWYYVRAECDFDGNSSVNSTFETTFNQELVYIDNENK
ncbi:MAG: prepilin-type N-terminal cleavage/methylation domain-containing protein [bacterium]